MEAKQGKGIFLNSGMYSVVRVLRRQQRGHWKLLLGIERDLREERRGHQEGLWKGTCGASQVPPGRKLLDHLDAVCSRHSQSTKHVFLVTPVDSQIVLNTTVWKPWGDNFATPGLLPGSACALFELHGHGNEN